MGMLKKLLMFLMVIYIAVCFNQNMFSQTTTKKKPQELEKKNTPPREKPSFKNYWKKDMLARQAASFNLTNRGGTSLFYVQDDGKVGIGTMSPNEKLEVAGTIFSTTGGIKFPDGSLQTTAATINGGNTLDQAYDQGGSGLGRTITADAGAVNIVGPVGLTTTGRIGIGTTAPEFPLHVKGNFMLEGADFRIGEPSRGDGGRALVHWGSGSGTDDYIILNYAGDFEQGVKIEGSKLVVDGNVGIGTDSPEFPLHVKGDFMLEGTDFRMGDPRRGDGGRVLVHWGSGSGTDDYIILNYAGDFEQGIEVQGSGLVVDGKVGIGTRSPTHLLTVNGTVKAEELILSPSGADFVFEDDYKLRSLDKVEAYIQENKHLPEIPSAEEMEKDGVGTGKFQSKLLQKVEELTLYLIQMKKNQDAQSNRLKVLEEENRALKNRIAFLERIKQQEGD